MLLTSRSNFGEHRAGSRLLKSKSQPISNSALKVCTENLNCNDNVNTGEAQNALQERPHELIKSKINNLMNGSIPPLRKRGLKFAHLNIRIV